jgi:hypothetical protein
MYSGKLIDELIQAVQRAEAESRESMTAQPKTTQSGMVNLQMFMHQMQHAQRVRLGA